MAMDLDGSGAVDESELGLILENLGENLEKRLPRPPNKIQARSTSNLVFINLPKVGNNSDL